MSSCLIIYQTEEGSFLWLGKLSYLFLTFYLSCSQCHKTSSRVSLMWMSCQCPFLWDIFTLYAIYADKFVPLAPSKFLWISSFSNHNKILMFPCSAISSKTSFMFNLNFTLVIPLFISLLHFHLHWPISSFNYLWVYYWKTRRKCNHMLCLCVWIGRQMHSNQWAGFNKKGCDWSPMRTKELATKFVLYAIILTDELPWQLKFDCVVGELVLFK